MSDDSTGIFIYDAYIRILRVKSAGLLEEWEKWFTPTPFQCLKINQRDNSKRRLTLKHLSSAFVIIATGWVFSILVFVIENFTSFLR